LCQLEALGMVANDRQSCGRRSPSSMSETDPLSELRTRHRTRSIESWRRQDCDYASG
jgi:hypothetical protein